MHHLFFIFPIILRIVLVQGQENCLNPISPVVEIVTSLGVAHLFPPGSVEINVDADFSRVYFECRDKRPVEWIIDINPDRDRFQFSASLNTRRNEDFVSMFYFLHKPPDLRDNLFICQNSCGNRTYVEIAPGLYSASLSVTQSPKGRFRNVTRVPANVSNTTCDVTLLVHYDNAGRLFHKWVTATGDIRIQKRFYEVKQGAMDQSVYFHNVFRSVQQLKGQQCARGVAGSDCHDCEEIEPWSTIDEGEGVKLNSVAFYARANTGMKMAFKGVLSLTKPRRFYFDWQLDLNEMMDFNPPKIVYEGHQVLVTCSVSVLYFSYGTRIFSENSNATGEIEIWQKDGRRDVSNNLTFSSPHAPRRDVLTCSAPLWNWSGWVNKSVEVIIETPEIPRINGTELETRIFHSEDYEKEGNITLRCEATGNPRPSVEWIYPTQALENSLAISRSDLNSDSIWIISSLIFSNASKEFLGSYTCIASSLFGRASKTFRILPPAEGGLSDGAKAGIYSSLTLLLLIGLTVSFLIYRRILLQRQEFRTKRAEAIREFKEGLVKANKGLKNKLADADNDNAHIFFGKQKSKKACFTAGNFGENEYEYHSSILELPYNDKFEVGRDKWEISDKFLGQGAFGFVKKGEVQLADGKSVTVAIKMLRTSVEIEDFKGFLTELKIMAYIGQHTNVVSLIAACTQDLEDRDILIGVEFCSNGSLCDYLQEKRNMFQTADPDLQQQASRLTYANLSNPVTLTDLDLYTWCYQIAKGMDFLSTKRVLHGDLASRNVLLTADKTAKISDFGLSRVLIDANRNYLKKSRVPLPWKWMAIESLKTLQFSTHSDVWAYGVTLWEIWTLGEAPYGGLSYGPEFITQVDNGYRLPKPNLATDYVYNIMRHCWTPDREMRVTFPQLKTAFAELLQSFTNPERGPEVLSRTLQYPHPVSVSHQPSPIAQPRRTRAELENLYANARPTQIQNLYLNV